MSPVPTKSRAAHERAVLMGRKNREAGALWERIIEKSCEAYRRAGIAEIEKTPEPVKQLGSMDGRGHFDACYLRRAQPDYKGTLVGGKAVVFEAKHTSSERLQQSVVSEDQAMRLELHNRLGAECFVLVSFSFQQFFKIPWEVFRSMKARFGRKYITPEDVEMYRVKFTGGLLRFLEDDDERSTER